MTAVNGFDFRLPFSPETEYEECRFYLEKIEHRAFSFVVSALRAQGPPSEYTDILIEHLKEALFISNEIYRAEVRRATNDDNLRRCCQVLNPSYDVFTEWAIPSLEGRNFIETRPPPAQPFSKTTTLQFADKLLSLARNHNDRLNDKEARTVELLALPPQPYVPERLRLILRETENVPEERWRPLPDKTVHAIASSSKSEVTQDEGAPAAKKRRGRQPKVVDGVRPPHLIAEKKAEENGRRISVANNHSIPNTSVVSPLSLPSTSLSLPSSSNATAIPVHLLSPTPSTQQANREWIEKISASVKQQQALEGDEVEDKEAKKRTRRSKQDMQLTNSCARTRPFIFEPAQGGKKPARGNPDKRSAKRTSPSFAHASSIGVVPAAVTANSSTIVPLQSRLQQTTSLYPGATVKNGVDEEPPQRVNGLLSGYNQGPVRLPATTVKRNVYTAVHRPTAKYYVNSVQGASSSQGSFTSPSSASSSATSLINNTPMRPIAQSASNVHTRTPGTAGTIPIQNGHSSLLATPSTSSSSLHQPIPPSSIPNSSTSTLPVEDLGHDYGLPPSTSNASFSTSSPVSLVSPPNNHFHKETPGIRFGPKSGCTWPKERIGVRSSQMVNGQTPTSTRGGIACGRGRGGVRTTTVGGNVSGQVQGHEEITEETVQATVNSIMLEAAQLERANGKRSSVPKELLEKRERENAQISGRVLSPTPHIVPSTTLNRSQPLSSSVIPSSVRRQSSSPVNSPLNINVTNLSVGQACRLLANANLGGHAPTPTTSPTQLTTSHSMTSSIAQQSSTSHSLSTISSPQSHLDPSLQQLLNHLSASNVKMPFPLTQSLPSSLSSTLDPLSMAVSNMASYSGQVPQQPSPRIQRQFLLQPAASTEFRIDKAIPLKELSAEDNAVPLGVSNDHPSDQSRTNTMREEGGHFTNSLVNSTIVSPFYSGIVRPNGTMNAIDNMRENNGLMVKGSSSHVESSSADTAVADILQQSCMEIT